MEEQQPIISEDDTNININDDSGVDEDVTRPVDVLINRPDEQPESTEETNNPQSQAVETNDAMIANLKQEADKNRDLWQRAMADFQNYKRRVEREKEDTMRRISSDIVKKILPIIDDFERASANIPEELQDNAWVNGTMLIQGKFQKLLEEHDVETIDPVGEEFDPNSMEAIGVDDNPDVTSGHVTVTLQKGYRSGDRVLRPALVRIAN